MCSGIDHDGVVADVDTVSRVWRDQIVTGRPIGIGAAQRYAVGTGGRW